MIGVSLSMLAILTMLKIFETLRLTSSEAQAVAALNTSQSSSLLTAEMLLANSSYGIATPTYLVQSNMVLNTNVAEATATIVAATPTAPDASRANVILWSEQDILDASKTRCVGLISPTQTGGLATITKSDCASPTTTGIWSYAWLNETTSRTQPWYLTFALVPSVACSPFGLEENPGSHSVLSIGVLNNATPLSKICLINT